MTATKAIPVKRLLSAQAYQLIDREIAKYPADQKQSAVMGALTIAQDEVGWVSPAVIEDVADYLSMPPIAVYEVATFYNMYNLEEVGTWKIGVCTCLPCALREGDKAGEYLKQKLGIHARRALHADRDRVPGFVRRCPDLPDQRQAGRELHGQREA